MIPNKVLDWLLEEDNPSVRFLTLTTLLGRSDEEADEARKAIMTIGPVPEILAKQNDDGSWGDPGRFYLDKYQGSIWTLILLSELAPDPGNEQITKACEFVLRVSQEEEEGGFSFKTSVKKGHGLESCVIPCLTGNMVYALIRLGYVDDERIRKAIDWIIRVQPADDGDNDPPAGKIYERNSMCWGSHSCHMGVAKGMKALAAIPAEKRSDECVKKLAMFSNYFLIHHLYKKSHHLDQVSKPGWLKLGFPLMYQTDILELAGIMAHLGIHDDRLHDAIEIIRSKQMSDGRWKLENSFNGKMLVSIEKKGLPSKWITLQAIKVLNGYQAV